MRIRNVVLSTLFLAGAFACAEGETLKSGGLSGVDGTTGAGAGEGTSATCKLGTSDQVCDDCINTNCFGSCDACANNQACKDLLTCVAGCEDSTCENTCIGQNPAGEAPLNAFIGETGCMDVSCEQECTTCGLTTSDSVCDDCMNANCYTECGSCADTPECLGLLDCWNDCSDVACEDQCSSTYANGYDPLLNLLGTDGCMALKCSTQCGE